jgi:hypothetical protein
VGAVLGVQPAGGFAAVWTYEVVDAGREVTVTVLPPAPPFVLLGGVDCEAAQQRPLEPAV